MSDLRERLLQAFAVEHREHIEASREMLASFGREGVTPDLVELHRRMHSLKGAARATDLRPIEALAHRIESLISEMQKGTVPLDASPAGVILDCLDSIEDWFAAYAEGGDLPPLDEASSAIEGFVHSPVGQSRSAGGRPSAGSAIASTLGSGPPTAVRDSLRVDTASLDRLLRCAGEILVAGGQLQKIDVEFRRLSREIDRSRREFESLRLKPAYGRAVPMPADAHGNPAGRDPGERLANAVTGLYQACQMHREYSWRSIQLARWLHEEVKQVRLVPAESSIVGFRKIVRDLARDLGKKIDVHISGADTRADRAVLQALKDPLLHILRNAVYHGIERPEDRRAKGKAEAGKVLVAISTRGSRFEVRVQDDGRGLDFAQIDRVGRDSGALSDEDGPIDSISDAQILLTRSGFTTAESVNEISGRGLGLSVVQQAVAKLQGDLSIGRSDVGGLVVTISVPLSVATMPVLLVEAAGAAYAIPSHSIEKLHLLNRADVEMVDGRPVFGVAGETEAVALVRLDHLVGADHAVEQVGDRITVAVTRAAGSCLGLVVDGAIAVRDAVIEDLGAALPGQPLLIGAIAMEDGALTPVLDTAALFDRYARGLRTEHTSGVTPVSALPKAPVVLIVDDSITARTLEKSLLEANGYRVRLAVDGLDALEQLRAAAVDLVVSDVEMPRMDGFDLLREMRRDQALAKIPVVLVTSRDKEEDRKRGLYLGAEAYVVKQRFDQTDLLETIGQLI